MTKGTSLKNVGSQVWARPTHDTSAQWPWFGNCGHMAQSWHERVKLSLALFLINLSFKLVNLKLCAFSSTWLKCNFLFSSLTSLLNLILTSFVIIQWCLANKHSFIVVVPHHWQTSSKRHCALCFYMCHKQFLNHDHFFAFFQTFN